mmetsp:Transcript_37365/g.90738  ORF Transcript_37365/g.90738 Transcript_37365/m.90738 type:complete len:101 (-) Transcript_37365:618-920(-)
MLVGFELGICVGALDGLREGAMVGGEVVGTVGVGAIVGTTEGADVEGDELGTDVEGLELGAPVVGVKLGDSDTVGGELPSCVGLNVQSHSPPSRSSSNDL